MKGGEGGENIFGTGRTQIDEALLLKGGGL